MAPQGRTAEREIARIASAQKGLATRADLLGAGLTHDEIRHRVRTGLLIPQHRGVYWAGHRASDAEAAGLAAVLACGPGALLMGRAAGHLLGLLKGPPPAPEVMTPTERRIEGLATRRCRRIDPRDTARFNGIPVTTVPRTLVDLASVLAVDALARACHEAGVVHRTTPAQVAAALERRPNSRGAARLRQVLAGDVHVTLSALERAFLRRLRDAGLPLPQTNRPAGGRRVDCRWPARRLTVELDSYRFHSSRHAWEQDRRREREARARGDEFRRYTYGDVLEHPGYMLRELRALLGGRAR